MAKQRNKRVEGKLAEREKGDVVAVKGQDFSGIKKEGRWREDISEIEHLERDQEREKELSVYSGVVSKEKKHLFRTPF